MNKNEITNLVIDACITLTVIAALGYGGMLVIKSIANQEVNDIKYDYLNSLTDEQKQAKSLIEALEDNKITRYEYKLIKCEIKKQVTNQKVQQLKNDTEFKVRIQ